jgi:hypothetical protein
MERGPPRQFAQANGHGVLIAAPSRIRQDCVFAACNLYVVLGSFPLPLALPSEEEFRALIGER